MRAFHTSTLRQTVLIAATLAALHATASASILFREGNLQYNQVNLVSTNPTAYTVIGHVRDQGVSIAEVQINGYGADQQTPVLLLSRNGAASVERVTAGSLFQLVITTQPGFVMTAGDFALDQENRLPDGQVSFSAFTASGGLVSQDPLSPPSFTLRANGQNQFNFLATKDDAVSKLVFTSLRPLADLKQVTLEVVNPPLGPESAPEPGSLLTVAGAFSCWLAGRRRRTA